MAVYFAKTKGLNRVKIGYTSSKDPKSRISSLQTSSADDLEIVYFDKDAERWEEKNFHKKFKDCHINREWFYYRPLVSEFVGDHNLDLPIKDKSPVHLTGLQDRYELALYRTTHKHIEQEIDTRTWVMLRMATKFAFMGGEEEFEDFVHQFDEDFGDLRTLNQDELGWVELKRKSREKKLASQQRIQPLYAY